MAGERISSSVSHHGAVHVVYGAGASPGPNIANSNDTKITITTMLARLDHHIININIKLTHSIPRRPNPLLQLKIQVRRTPSVIHTSQLPPSFPTLSRSLSLSIKRG